MSVPRIVCTWQRSSWHYNEIVIGQAWDNSNGMVIAERSTIKQDSSIAVEVLALALGVSLNLSFSLSPCIVC